MTQYFLLLNFIVLLKLIRGKKSFIATWINEVRIFTTQEVSKFASPTLMGLGFKKGGDNSNDGFKEKKVGSRIQHPLSPEMETDL